MIKTVEELLQDITASGNRKGESIVADNPTFKVMIKIASCTEGEEDEIIPVVGMQWDLAAEMFILEAE